MKRILLLIACLTAFMACDRDEYENKTPTAPALYLDAAAEHNAENVFFKRTVDTRQRKLAALLSSPVDREVKATLAVDASAVDRYNTTHGTSYELLGEEHFSLSAAELTIAAGEVRSPQAVVNFKGLQALPLDATYLLPVSVSTRDVKLLGASATIWYLVKQTSAVTTAADLTDNWISFPTLDKAGPHSDIYNGLTAVTYEMIVRVKRFDKTASISSLMGVEQYLLLRLGDTGFPRQQLQVQAGANKFPDSDDVKSLDANEWYHLAMTYDAQIGQMRIYVNGEVQSEGTVKWGGGVVNLAMRAMFDADPEANASLKESYQFFLGRSYDDKRPLQGEVAEVRVWSKARTAKEIWASMYDVDPASDALLGYWKFDTPEDGDVVRDVTGRGNDGVASKKLKWNTSVEVPQINKE